MKVIRRWAKWELVYFGDHWYELHRLECSVNDFSTEIVADDDTDAIRKVLCIIEVEGR